MNASKHSAKTKIKHSTFDFRSLMKLWPWLRPNRHLVLTGSAMIPVVAIISMIQPQTIRLAIDEGILKGDLSTTLRWASACLGLSFANYIFSGIQSITTATAVHRMIRDLRSALVKHVLNMAPAWHDHQISGALTTRATSDFDTLSDSLNQGVLSSIIDVMVLIGCIAGMFLLSPKLALSAVIILPLMTWIVMWFSRKLNASMLATRKHLAALNGFAQESFTSLNAVKLLNAESGVARRFQSYNKNFRDAQLENVFYDSFMFSTIDGISSITLGIVLFIAIKAVGHTDLTAGIMVAFVQYVHQLFDPLKQLGSKMAMLQGAFTSIERIFGLLDRHDHVRGEQPAAWNHSVRITFDDVTFSYQASDDPNRKQTLSNISFTIPPGESLAIVGSTGSGKSSIVKLMTKLYDGYQGKILIDNQSIIDIAPHSLRQNMGIVPQDIVMFEGTVAFNIGIGRDIATPEAIALAARTVGAHTFIETLPGGYDFMVKEHGSNLSHGQKQLIVFARSLVSKPPVLILDEATSSIDPHSEALIQAATKKLLADRTVVVIAHRLETIKQCQNILVLEHGKIVESGSPRELLQRQGRYFDLLHMGKHHVDATE